MNAEELAFVAFWDLDTEQDKMVCQRFFIIPNPMKRMIEDKEGTVLYQVLYVSDHTNEVFFFFKGYEMTARTDVEKTENEGHHVL